MRYDVMNSILIAGSLFCDVSLEVNHHCGEIWRLHLQGRRICLARNQREKTRSRSWTKRPSIFNGLHVGVPQTIGFFIVIALSTSKPTWSLVVQEKNRHRTVLTAVMNIWNRIKSMECLDYISVAFSPQANYTDWATATFRRNLVPTFVDRGVSRGGFPTAVNLSFLDRSRYFFFKDLLISAHEAEWTPFQTHCYSENLASPGIEPRNSDH
jgi:hypothetical protein